MKHFRLASLVLVLLSFTMACSPNEKVNYKVFGHGQTKLVTKALNSLAVNQQTEVLFDTTLQQPLNIQLFVDPCRQVNSVVSINEYDLGTAGAKLVTMQDVVCPALEGEWYKGYVLLSVNDPVTGRPTWVPCPALFRAGADTLELNQVIDMSVLMVRLSPYDNGTAMLVQR